jgi:major membrane immunogen (membrane-anchored lipoprotein)
MKKIAVVLAFALAVLFMSCGGSNLKGTVWVGKKGVEMKASMGFQKPELTFNMMEFDGKEDRVSISTAPGKFLEKNREYIVENGKELVIFTDDKKDVMEFKKKDPAVYEAYTLKGTLAKDTITVGKAEFKKATRDEADKMLKELTDDFNTKQAAYEAEVDAYESKFK